MNNLYQLLAKIHPLSKETFAQVVAITQIVSYPKGTTLVKTGVRNSKIYFIERGAARAYYTAENKEVTIWFGLEGDIIASLYQYVAGKPGYETIDLLEDSCLYLIDGTDLQTLYNQNIEMANFGRKLAEYALVITEERFISYQFLPAKERYLELLKNHPQILQRIPLGYIASYLGITQVTLSRIRADLKKK